MSSRSCSGCRQAASGNAAVCLNKRGAGDIAIRTAIIGIAGIAVRLYRPTEPDSVTRKVGTMPFGLYASVDYPHLHAPAQWQFITYGPELADMPHQQWMMAVPLLRRLPFEGEGFAREIWLVLHVDLRHSPLLRAVTAFLVEVRRLTKSRSHSPLTTRARSSHKS